MDRRHALLTLAAAPTLLAMPALAQTTRIPMQPQMGGDMRSMALMGGAFALQTSQLATQRSRNGRIRQFAQLEANEQMAYAAALGAQPDSVALRPDHAQMLEQLSAMSGPRFDAMYLRGQVAGHQELLQINQQMASAGPDQVSRAVAMLAVPSIQTHLVMLSQMGGGRARG